MPRRLFPLNLIVPGLWLAGTLLTVLPGSAPLLGSSHSKEPPPPGPEQRIPVGPLGTGRRVRSTCFPKGVQLPGLY